MRLLVVLVVTVALLVAAAPIALTQAPRLHSPLLAVVAFGVAGIALLAGAALLGRAMMLHRRARTVGPRAAGPGRAGARAAGPRPEALRARIVPAPRSGVGRPAADDAESEPRGGPDRIVLVPTAGRIAVSTGASVTGPRHALSDEPAAPGQSRQDPSTAGQSPTGPSQTHAQQISGGPDDAADPVVEEASAARSAAFAARYTATRSRR